MLGGCAIGYYGQAMRGQLELMNRREPIQQVIENGADEGLVDDLTEVLGIRRYAIEELGLPDNGSYASYADLERPYVVWNVVAAPEFSVEPEKWCFLFVGCLSYRGFFRESAARSFADKQKAKGFEVHVGGVTAYSTLGVFADPVLNTMLSRGEVYVAATIFHELAHQRVYVKNDSSLSEAFATVVEEFATERWLRDSGRHVEADRYLEQLNRRYQFAELVASTRRELQDLFAMPLEEDEMRDKKVRVFEDMERRYQKIRAAWGGALDYEWWFDQPLNNARLAAVATYRQWVPGLRMKLDQTGDLEQFFTLVEGLVELDPEERQGKLSLWREQATQK